MHELGCVKLHVQSSCVQHGWRAKEVDASPWGSLPCLQSCKQPVWLSRAVLLLLLNLQLVQLALLNLLLVQLALPAVWLQSLQLVRLQLAQQFVVLDVDAACLHFERLHVLPRLLGEGCG